MAPFTPIAVGSSFSFSVTEEYKDMRLDNYVAKQFVQYSRTFFQRMIDDRLITINGFLATKASALVKMNDTVHLIFPLQASDQKESAVFAGKSPIAIIFEHEHFFIIEKPAGWLVHAPNRRCVEPTVVDWLLSKDVQIKSVGVYDRPGIVHRLDKETSGLMVIARTNYAHQLFGQFFYDRTIEKTYIAIVAGKPPCKGSIDFPLVRDPLTNAKMSCVIKRWAQDPYNSVPTGARKALTHYTVLAQFETAALVEFTLITGRTHQIRVHASAIGHPLIGDKLYGQVSSLIGRQALHAHKLAFTFDNQRYEFSSPAPADFQLLLNHLRDE